MQRFANSPAPSWLITFVPVSNAFCRFILELIPVFSAFSELCYVMLMCFALYWA